MAPPGAETTTPPWPSGVGPLEDQVYCWPCSAHTPPHTRRKSHESSKLMKTGSAIAQTRSTL